jgi:hypothetical protein
MNDYYAYRLEHGLSAAQQRAADQRIGETAKALAELRREVARSFGRGLGALMALVRADRVRNTERETRSTATAAGH